MNINKQIHKIYVFGYTALLPVHDKGKFFNSNIIIITCKSKAG